MKRPFRFGVGAGQVVTRTQIKESARRFESLGYSTFLIPDHFSEQLAPIPALMLAAEATTTLRVGSFVFGNDYHHPAMLAKEAATLDLLSDGRLELGIGAGWFQGEYEAAGLRFDPPGIRVERLMETVTILKGLLRGGRFSFQGKHYRINGLENFPLPLQRPHPPLFIGGGGRRLLSFAGAEADIIGLAPKVPSPDRVELSSITAAAAADKIGWIKAAAGTRFDSLEINCYPSLVPMQITDDRRGAASAALDRLVGRFPGQSLSEDELLDSPHVWLGNTDQMAEKLVGLRERFQVSYLMVPDEVADAFAPVVERLAGR